MEATSDIEKFLNILKGLIFITSDALLHKQLHILVLRNRDTFFTHQYYTFLQKLVVNFQSLHGV